MGTRAWEPRPRRLAPEGRFAFAVWAEAGANLFMISASGVVAGLVDLPRPKPGAPSRVFRGVLNVAKLDREFALRCAPADQEDDPDRPQEHSGALDVEEQRPVEGNVGEVRGRSGEATSDDGRD